MIKHLVDIAIRNIVKYKFYSVINLSGLAVGIAGFVIIAIYIDHELDYDKVHENGDRIYRVATITRLVLCLCVEIESYIRVHPAC